MTDKLITIGVRDAEVAADIGMLAHEIGRPQMLRITATLRIHMPDADEIDATVDYKRIMDAANLLGARRIALIETFARMLAEECLQDPRVEHVDIRVEKPHALVSGCAFTHVTMHRQNVARSDASIPFVD